MTHWPAEAAPERGHPPPLPGVVADDGDNRPTSVVRVVTQQDAHVQLDRIEWGQPMALAALRSDYGDVPRLRPMVDDEGARRSVAVAGCSGAGSLTS